MAVATLRDSQPSLCKYGNNHSRLEKKMSAIFNLKEFVVIHKFFVMDVGGGDIRVQQKNGSESSAIIHRNVVDSSFVSLLLEVTSSKTVFL